MVVPLLPAIAAGTIIAGAAVQWLNSREAAAATAAERKRVEDLVNKVRQPDFDMRNLTPEDYQVVGTYTPQVASFVEANAPQTVKADSADAVAGRDAEKEALENMLQLARNGKDPLFDIDLARASRSAAANAQSARKTIDAQMQRRGLGVNSGLAFAGNQQAISDAYMTDALAGEAAAADAAKRRGQYNVEAGNLGSKIYGEEVSLAEKNAGIMNDFNQWLRDARQRQTNTQADTQNNAQKFNIENAQDVANKNITGRNVAAVNNLDRRNNIAQKQFDNDMDLTKTKAGLSNQRVGDIAGNVAQRNSAIQGMTEGAAKIAMYGQDRMDRSETQEREDARDKRYLEAGYDPMVRK